jgi:hypothetical protein
MHSLEVIIRRNGPDLVFGHERGYTAFRPETEAGKRWIGTHLPDADWQNSEVRVPPHGTELIRAMERDGLFVGGKLSADTWLALQSYEREIDRLQMEAELRGVCWAPKCTSGWSATPKPGAVRMSLDEAKEAANAHAAAVEAAGDPPARRHYVTLNCIPLTGRP